MAAAIKNDALRCQIGTCESEVALVEIWNISNRLLTEIGGFIRMGYGTTQFDDELRIYIIGSHTCLSGFSEVLYFNRN
jgi:hypothetical protein